MKTHTLKLDTGNHRRIVDITREVKAFVEGESKGLLNIFVPHATAGLAIIELGSGTEEDLLNTIDRILPRDDGIYRHSHGSEGHGADHVIPAFIAPTLTLPVIDGAIQLGTWQSIALIDTNVDNPRREVMLCLLN